jgi:hypothetical protein
MNMFFKKCFLDCSMCFDFRGLKFQLIILTINYNRRTKFLYR